MIFFTSSFYFVNKIYPGTLLYFFFINCRSKVKDKMPNCKMEDSSGRSSTGENGHHHPHRRLFQEDNGHEEVKQSCPDEPVDRDTVRL